MGYREVLADTINLAQARPIWPLVVEYVESTFSTRHEYSPAAIATVVTDMRARHEFGMAHYGVPFTVGVKEDNIAEAYEEALDMAVYLRTDLDAQKEPIERGATWNLFERAVELVFDLRTMMLRRAEVRR